MSATDDLTGLPNRSAFTLYLEENADQLNRSAAWLAVFDIDGFIYLNDQFGHLVGDSVLREVGSLLVAETEGRNLSLFRIVSA